MSPPPPPSSGNIFGWRVSLIGAVVITTLVLLAWLRHERLDVPSGFEDPLENQRIRDSIREYELRRTSRPPERITPDSARQ